jgi:hypothetical protein
MIATTNYDCLIERAYNACPKAVQTPVKFIKDDEPVEDRMQATAKPLAYLKLHGCLDHIFDRDVPLILSREQYASYAQNRTHLFERLKHAARESTLLFIGYRLDDPHIRELVYKLESNRRPRWYIVTPDAEDYDINFWASRNIEVIKARFGEFMQALDAEVPPLWRSMAVIFETAVRLAPTQAFLHQQWAIFELNHAHGSIIDAEKHAADAHELDPRSKPILHTQAEIDRRRANDEPSVILRESLIPQKFGVTNVYAEFGTPFANSAVAHPKFSAALVGTLIKGMGVDHVMWGTDSVWYGSPQWQIEALRRLEIPEDMRKKYGFALLDDANSATKQLIFGGNATKFYKIRLKAADNTKMPAFSEDRIASLKNEYALAAKEPSNLRYGYVRAA